VLFAAARADHLDQVIRPALERGAWVVCDRFVDSTRVYQGALGKVDPRLLRGLERLTVGDAVPNLTVILDIAPEIGLQRARSRAAGANADRFENEGQDFHEQLRAAYREIAAREPGRCILVDADAAEEKVAEEIWDAVRRRLGSAPVEMAAGVLGR
jgi:dTMP kinase